MKDSQYPTVEPSNAPTSTSLINDTTLNANVVFAVEHSIEFDWFLVAVIVSGAAVCFIISCLVSAWFMNKNRKRNNIANKVSVDNAAYVDESISIDNNKQHRMMMMHTNLQRVPTEEDFTIEMAINGHAFNEEMNHLYDSDSDICID